MNGGDWLAASMARCSTDCRILLINGKSACANLIVTASCCTKNYLDIQVFLVYLTEQIFESFLRGVINKIFKIHNQSSYTGSISTKQFANRIVTVQTVENVKSGLQTHFNFRLRCHSGSLISLQEQSLTSKVLLCALRIIRYLPKAKNTRAMHSPGLPASTNLKRRDQ